MITSSTKNYEEKKKLFSQFIYDIVFFVGFFFIWQNSVYSSNTNVYIGVIYYIRAALELETYGF